MQFDSTIMFQIILDSDSICNCSCFMLSCRMTGEWIGHLSKEILTKATTIHPHLMITIFWNWWFGTTTAFRYEVKCTFTLVRRNLHLDKSAEKFKLIKCRCLAIFDKSNKGIIWWKEKFYTANFGRIPFTQFPEFPLNNVCTRRRNSVHLSSLTVSLGARKRGTLIARSRV